MVCASGFSSVAWTGSDYVIVKNDDVGGEASLWKEGGTDDGQVLFTST